MYLRDAMATKNNPPKKKRLRKRTLVSHLMSCALLSLWEAFIYIYSNSLLHIYFNKQSYSCPFDFFHY